MSWNQNKGNQTLMLPLGRTDKGMNWVDIIEIEELESVSSCVKGAGFYLMIGL